MSRAAAGATAPVEDVEGWLARARRLPADRVTTWRSFAGGCDIAFCCTDRRTAAQAAARLVGPNLGDAPSFRLGLLETDVLGWAPPKPCESQAQSLALTRRLGHSGIAAIIPVRSDGDACYPWVVFETASRTGFVVVRTVADLPPWMVAAPFSLLLHLAVAWQGRRLLHAASLGHAGRGALIVGPGGAGKSATTIAGLCAGLSTVGDDYLVLGFGETPRAHPVYRVLKQSPDGLARLPAVRERTAALPLNWHGKVEFDAALARPGCLASSLDIDVILIPRQTGRADTAFVPAPPTAAFSALAPSTLFQLPGSSLDGFAGMTRLTRAVPAFWLDLSTDADEIGATLRGFLTDRRR